MWPYDQYMTIKILFYNESKAGIQQQAIQEHWKTVVECNVVYLLKYGT